MMNIQKTILTFSLLGALTLGASCRGRPFKEPPIHPNLNMDFQSKLDPQEEFPFFEDRRAMRPLVDGTVARGTLRLDDHMYRGVVGGQPSRELPEQLTLNRELLNRGQERYAIYCAVCHGGTGVGDGMVTLRGPIQNMPSLLSGTSSQRPVGEVYQIISNGFGRMPAYAHQISHEDRWAIAAYLKALQLSRQATLEQVPEDVARDRGWTR